MQNPPETEPKSFKSTDTAPNPAADTKAKDTTIHGSGAHADDVEDNRDRHTEKQLDHGLKETFPASDPVSINPGAD